MDHTANYLCERANEERQKTKLFLERNRRLQDQARKLRASLEENCRDLQAMCDATR